MKSMCNTSKLWQQCMYNKVDRAKHDNDPYSPSTAFMESQKN